MKIEQQRGISVTSSVMTFEKNGITFNLLDTPGHEDFSEDTYRTLTAVDSAIMVIDAAKGIEPQTRKLFEVCRLRSVPIITFVNKVDREGRSPFELLDGVVQVDAEAASPLQRIAEPMARIATPSDEAEVTRFRAKFFNAGIRARSAPIYFFAVKALLALALPLIGWIGIQLSGIRFSMAVALAFLMMLAAIG